MLPSAKINTLILIIAFLSLVALIFQSHPPLDDKGNHMFEIDFILMKAINKCENQPLFDLPTNNPISFTNRNFVDNPIFYSFSRYVAKFRLQRFLNQEMLSKYLCSVQSLYLDVPYHNKLHPAFLLDMLSDMLPKLPNGLFESKDVLIIGLAALNHDIIHPGRTNSAFSTEDDISLYHEILRALKKNTNGFLERIHSYVAFRLIEWYQKEGLFDDAGIKRDFFANNKNEPAKAINAIRQSTYDLLVTDFKDDYDYLHHLIMMTNMENSHPAINNMVGSELRKEDLAGILLALADLNSPLQKDSTTSLILSTTVMSEMRAKKNKTVDKLTIKREMFISQAFFLGFYATDLYETLGKLNELKKVPFVEHFSLNTDTFFCWAITDDAVEAFKLAVHYREEFDLRIEEDIVWVASGETREELWSLFNSLADKSKTKCRVTGLWQALRTRLIEVKKIYKTQKQFINALEEMFTTEAIAGIIEQVSNGKVPQMPQVPQSLLNKVAVFLGIRK